MKPTQQCLENCGVLPSGFPGHGKDPSKVTQFKHQWNIDALFVADAALYTAGNLTQMSQLRWVSRVPVTLTAAKQLLYAMVFTSIYESEVAGLVFVDASHPDQVAPIKKIVGTTALPSGSLIPLIEALARIGLVRLGSMGNTQQNALLPNAPPSVIQIEQAYLPQKIGSVLKAFQFGDEAITAAGQFRKLGGRPLVVLTAMKKLSSDELRQMGMSQEQEMQMKALWKQLQADQATWSTHSRHEIVPDSDHYIQFDRPDVVIKAVREVVSDVRQTKAKNQ